MIAKDPAASVDHCISFFSRGIRLAQKVTSLFLCLLLLSLLHGCSGSEEQQKEEGGAVEQMTATVAREAVENIRLPMEKAKQVQALQDAHTRAMEEAVESSQ